MQGIFFDIVEQRKLSHHSDISVSQLISDIYMIKKGR
jgi:hypothetical protein